MSGLIGFLNTPVTITTGANTLNVKEWSFDNDGNLKLPTGGNIINGNGSTLFAQNLSDLDDVSITDPITNGYVLKYNGTAWVAAADSTTNIGNFFIDADTITNDVQLNPIILRTKGVGLSTNTWTFDSDGTFTLPDDGSIVQNLSITKTVSSSIQDPLGEIVWTSSNNSISSVKLVIQVEANEVGDPSGYHNQSCEAIISSRGSVGSSTYGVGTPVISVYGVTYTSVNLLVTFTIQRNVINNNIEVVGTPTAFVDGNVSLRIYSIELLSSV